VEVLAAVAPAADVDALDVPDCEDRALDADEERPELRLSLGRETVEVAVLSRVEEHDDRQAARSRQRRDEPVLVAPDRVTVPGGAASAVHAALALARRVVRRRPERPGADLALERKGLPVVERRERKAAVLVGRGQGAVVELLGGLGHRCILAAAEPIRRR
jgi:hypothetical protein